MTIALSPEALAADPLLAERIATLRIEVDHAVESLLSGMHPSRRRGGGLVFAEHRDYRPGDDLRTLDWRAYARSDHFRTKHFEHEAQLRVVLALDVSGSMWFGGPALRQTKVGIAAVLLAALARVVLSQGDSAGGARLGHGLYDWLAPQRSPSQLGNVIELFARPAPLQSTTDLSSALSELRERTPRGAAIVVASDFLDLRPDVLQTLAALSQHGSRLVVFHVLHEHELSLPFDESCEFEGCEGEPKLQADPRALRAKYLELLEAHQQDVRRACERVGGRYLLVSTASEPASVLADALRRREAKAWA